MKWTKRILGILLLLIIAVVVAFWEKDIPMNELTGSYTNANSKFMAVSGAFVHYQDSNSALADSLPIVLIHGTGASLHTWLPWVKGLSNRRVITLDLPAYGLTGPNATSDYSTQKYVETVDSLLIKLNINRFIIGGNSLGGNVSWNYAVAHPEKVAKLILVDAAGYKMKSTSVPIAFKLARVPVLNNLLRYITPRFIIEKSVKNVYADQSKVSDALIKRYFDLTLREGNRQAFIERMSVPRNTIENLDASVLIKTVNIPTLILWGDQDRLIPIENAEKFHADLPNDTLVILKNLGHVPMEEDPAATLAVLKQFLKIK